MARPKKDSVGFNMKFDAMLMERFTKYCDDVGASKTAAAERIISAYLDEYEKNQKKFEPFKKILNDAEGNN